MFFYKNGFYFKIGKDGNGYQMISIPQNVFSSLIVKHQKDFEFGKSKNIGRVFSGKRTFSFFKNASLIKFEGGKFAGGSGPSSSQFLSKEVASRIY